MATLVLSTVGTALGGPVGGLLGSLVGQAIDLQLMGGGPRRGPRLNDLAVQTSSYGTPIPKIFGAMRAAGTVVWSTDLIETRELVGDSKSGGETLVYNYTASFAVALSARRAVDIGRIWADGKLVRGAAGDLKVDGVLRFLDGSEGQAVDPLIASIEGATATPAYRGLALAIFEDLALASFGNRIPNLTFEILGDALAPSVGHLLSQASHGAIQSDAERVVAGYAWHGSDIGSAALPLVEVYGLDLADDGGALRTYADRPAITLTLGEIGVGRDEDGRVAVERHREPARDVPSEIALTYYDAARDYQSGSARARIEAGHRKVQSLDLAMVADASLAKSLASDRLSRAWLRREQIVLRLPISRACVGPGVRVTIAGVDGEWIVLKQAIERMIVVLTLAPVGNETLTAPGDPGRAIVQPDVVALPSRLMLLDLSDFAGASPAFPTLHLAVSSPSGGYRSVPLEIVVGYSVTASQSARAEAVIGNVEGRLTSSAAELIDMRSEIDVELANPDHWLVSCDDAALAAGSNLAAIGTEIVQFARAQALAPGRFRLSRFVRGVGGSDWATNDHAEGEAFVLISSASLQDIPLSPAQVGSEVTIRALGAANREVANSISATARFEGARPLSPAGLEVEVEADGDIVLRWRHRSRLAWAWADEVEGARDQDVSGYRVTLAGPGATVVKETTTETVVMSSADAATLGARPWTISVVQVGSFGLSHATTIII